MSGSLTYLYLIRNTVVNLRFSKKKHPENVVSKCIRDLFTINAFSVVKWSRSLGW